MPEQHPYETVVVVGGGSWGTALALATQAAGRRTTLLLRDPDAATQIAQDRENRRYLPGIALSPALGISADPAICAAADALLLVAPAQHLRTTARALSSHIVPGTPVAICAKGIERDTGKLLHEVLGEELPQAAVAVLSGPSFARDVALGLPTAVVLAGALPIARRLQATLARPVFRPYASDDIAGVALCGAAKNVYAIACGLAAGYALGESARAGLLARSFAELSRLGAVLGARPETLMGLAGLGDLALSATSRSSRNFDYGFRLAAGTIDPEAAHPLAEGAATSGAILLRALAEGVTLPVAQAVHDVLIEPARGEHVIEGLLSRPVRDE